jgi:integrase
MMTQAGAAFFNYALKMEHLTKSPSKGAKKPQGGPGGRELTDDELTSLLGHAPEALYRTGTFSLNTYLRIEETCLLDWRWVFEIQGHGWFGRIPKETRKNAENAVKDCIFPINAAARAVMGARRPSGRVFPWSPWTVQHQLIAGRRAQQLPEDITFHCLRHTGATRYLASGGHMEDLLEESGSGLWKDPRSLLKYVHVRPETLAPRFAAVQFPFVAPTWPLNRNGQGRRPGHGLPALPDSTVED